jgi:hypothetical protein
MKYIKILILISIAFNCFAQNIYNNSSTPKDENLNIVLEERTVLDFNDSENLFVTNRIKAPNQIDKDSSFFFLDPKNSKMLKFDKNGQFITSFSNPGNGPGEFPNNFVTRFYVTNDSLYLVNHPERKILIFDTEGKFYSNRTYSRESGSGSGNMIVSNNKLIYGTFGGMYEKINRKLVLTDLNMKIIKEIYNQDTEETPAIIMSGKYNFEIACSKDEIYMSVPGDYGSYLINVYDYEGNLKYKIKKSYRKVKFDNEKEKERLKKHGISSKGMSDYKKPIEFMFCDSKGRLFVRSPKEDDKENYGYFDVFQNGEFINRVAFEVPVNIDGFAYRNDFAYGYDYDNNSMTVFQYEEVK